MNKIPYYENKFLEGYLTGLGMGIAITGLFLVCVRYSHWLGW